MNASVPEPTKIGGFTIWVIIALAALVIIALALALGGGTDEPEGGEPVGLSKSASLPPQA